MTLEAVLSQYGLAALFLGAGIEGGTVVVLGGVMVHRGLIAYPAAIAAAALGSCIADQIFFALGRRFRALKLWFVFRWYGAEGLREMIRRHCLLAREFADHVEADPRFELAAPVGFSTVCFRTRAPTGWSEETWNRRVLEGVNTAGVVFLSHTELDERFTIRLTVGNVNTERSHVKDAWDSLSTSLDALATIPAPDQ